MTDEKIKRINRLYHKSKAQGLTRREKREQKRLREEYISGFRKSVISRMDGISIKERDGTVTKPVRKKGGKGPGAFSSDYKPKR